MRRPSPARPVRPTKLLALELSLRLPLAHLPAPQINRDGHVRDYIITKQLSKLQAMAISAER